MTDLYRDELDRYSESLWRNAMGEIHHLSDDDLRAELKKREDSRREAKAKEEEEETKKINTAINFLKSKGFNVGLGDHDK